MLDVHPPHEAAHTWTDFFIHIATIVVGLLIAVALEQGVEAIHHHREVVEYHEQMRGVLENNLQLEPSFLQRSASFRAYMLELRNAVEARRIGHPLAAEPRPDDKRMRTFTATPSLAPYDVAVQNGTIALLSSDEVRMDARVARQRQMLSASMDEWIRAITDLESFEKQFTDSTGSLELTGIVLTPDLGRLSPVELLEYRKLIAVVIDATDRLMTRTVLFDSMGRAILDGASNEYQLMSAAGKQLGDNPWANLTPSTPK